MDPQTAKQQVIEAGRRLVEARLIARTWGNVSCRISETQFAVTPSGRAYDTLTPRDIVIVNISDLSHEGQIRPSSETGIHAAVYRLKPSAGFVIHTHQENASIVSALAPSATTGFLCAAYALPGTARLRKAVTDILENEDCRSIIMAHHGALCYGGDMDAAFAEAADLEKRCGDFLESVAPARSRDNDRLCRFDKRSGRLSSLPGEPSWEDFPIEAVGGAICRSRPDITHIIAISGADTIRASEEGKSIRPLLDDVAQIAGISLKTVGWDPRKPEESSASIVRALKGRNAVLLKGVGAICCASSAEDAEAVAMIVKKECRAYNAAVATGGAKPLNALECRLMRWNYLKYYSKKSGKA